MQGPTRWRFGHFEVDPREQQLRRDGVPVAVTRKSLALLVALLSRPGQLFTKAELFDTVWAGSAVTDASLSRAVRELRVALGDDAGAPAFIATVHGMGFRFVAPVQVVSDNVAGGIAAVSPPLGTTVQGHPPALQTVLRPPRLPGVVGRDTELALLNRLLAVARSGQRAVVFVTGEAGIGKTTLVEGFVSGLAGLAGAGGGSEPWFAHGRCIEQYGTREAYLPVLEALESLARQTGAETLRALLLRYAPAWLAQLPWLAHDVDAAVLQRALASASTQRMLRELAQALEVLAAERPIVLWLEDLHWSDYSTLDLVAYLAGRPEPARLMLIGSFRPGDASSTESPLQSLVHRLVQRGQASDLALSLLSEEAVGACVRSRLGATGALPMDELARFVYARTSGHALFTAAMVDDMIRCGRLTRGSTGWELAAPVETLGTGLPASLRLLVQRQIEQLAPEDRRLVEAAAVVGPDFSAAALAAALQDDVANVEECCLKLSVAGRFVRASATVAWPDGTESACFAFLHAIYWQGTYEGIAQARRAEWQQRIAEREERAFGAQCAQIAAELAMRFEVARDFPSCLRYLQLAGAAAVARCAYKEGVELLQHALELVPRLAPEHRARHELNLLQPLGAALMAVQGYAGREVEATYRRAAELARTHGRPGEVDRALRGLWNVALVRAELAAAQVAADELIVHAAARGDNSAAFDAFAKQGQTSLHRGEFRAAQRHLEHALALPISADDPMRLRESPRVLAYLAWVLWYTGHPEQALQRSQEALALALQAGSPHTEAFAHGFAGWLHHFRGETDVMQSMAERQYAVALEHGLVYWRVWADSLRALARALKGSVDQRAAGRDALRAALDEFGFLEADVGVSQFLCALAECELDAGELVRARQALDQSAALLARNGNAYHEAETLRLQGRLALAEGDGRVAALRFEAARAAARRRGALALQARAETALVAIGVRVG